MADATDIAAALRRPFPQHDLEWRIQRAGVASREGQRQVWATVTPYLTARAVADRLDAVFGPLGWTLSYEPFQVEGGRAGVLATLRVRDPATGDWIAKQDGAAQPEQEAVKGGFSAAFKRAAVHFGIGRWLYGVGVVYAEVSMERRPGWQRAQLKTDQGVVTYWWRVPPAVIRQVCGLAPDAPLDETPGPGPGAATSAGISERQLAYLRQLLQSPVWTEEERIAAEREWPKLSAQEASAKIGAIKAELARRKAAAEDRLLAGAAKRTDAPNGPNPTEDDDDLPF